MAQGAALLPVPEIAYTDRYCAVSVPGVACNGRQRSGCSTGRCKSGLHFTEGPEEFVAQPRVLVAPQAM